MKKFFTLFVLLTSSISYSSCPDLTGVYQECQLSIGLTFRPIGGRNNGATITQTIDSNQVVTYQDIDHTDNSQETIVTDGIEHDGMVASCVNDKLLLNIDGTEALIYKLGKTLVIQYEYVGQNVYFLCQ